MEDSLNLGGEAYQERSLNEPVAEERFVCVGVVAEGEDDAQAATCIVVGMVVVVVTVNVGVVADGTSVRPLRG